MGSASPLPALFPHKLLNRVKAVRLQADGEEGATALATTRTPLSTLRSRSRHSARKETSQFALGLTLLYDILDAVLATSNSRATLLFELYD